jgi:hypothetical protein
MTDLEREFNEFHADNPHVYALVIEFAMKAIAAGRTSLSIALIFERIRWHLYVDTKSDDEFKLNNNHRAFYARLFMQDHPQHRGFFELRRSAADVRARNPAADQADHKQAQVQTVP